MKRSVFSGRFLALSVLCAIDHGINPLPRASVIETETQLVSCLWIARLQARLVGRGMQERFAYTRSTDSIREVRCSVGDCGESCLSPHAALPEWRPKPPARNPSPSPTRQRR